MPEERRIVNDDPDEGPGIDPFAAVRPREKKPIKGWVIYAAGFGIGCAALGVVGTSLTSSFGSWLIGSSHSEPATPPPKTGKNINIGLPATKATPPPPSPPSVATPPKSQPKEDEEEQSASSPPAGWNAQPAAFAGNERAATIGNGQTETRKVPKAAFIANIATSGQPKRYGVDATRPRSWVGCSIRPTDLIQATVASHVNSQIPGLIIAVTNQPHFSMDDPRIELLPRGTRLLGLYSAENGGGDTLHTRLGFKIIAAQFPPGDPRQSLHLADANMVAMDVGGGMGVPGIVKRRWGQLILAAGLEALLNAGTGAATSGEDGYLASLQGEAADQSKSIVGGEMRRTLDTRPEISFPPGTRVTFSPYEPVKVSTRCIG